MNMSLKNYPLFVINFLLCLPILINAQNTHSEHTQRCGTMEALAHKVSLDESIIERQQALETFTAKYIEQRSNSSELKEMETLVTIPTVVHILASNSNTLTNISDEQVVSQIEATNLDLRRLNVDAADTRAIFEAVAADFEIELCLAQQTPEGLPTNGIVRYSTDKTEFFTTEDDAKFTAEGGADAWDPTRYFNVWVVNKIEVSPSNSSEILGYAQFPDSGPLETYGVVMAYYCFGTMGIVSPPNHLGRIFTHEVGHCLNLRHIWGDGDCEVDDAVTDTPRAGSPNWGCPSTVDTCEDENDLPDMTENYMDYTNDVCQNMFSEGQKARARALFAPGGLKEFLINSNACQVPIIGGNDAGIVALSSPSGGSVCTFFLPSVTLRNFGTNVLESVQFNINVDDDISETYLWEGSLAPFTETEVFLTPISIINGTFLHEISIATSQPNGTVDANSANDEITASFASILPGESLPFSDNFEASDFPFVAYNVSNNDNGTFTIAPTISGNAIVADNLNNGAAIGTLNEVALNEFDLSGSLTNISFAVAYAQTTTSVIDDVLSVQISLDCGDTFTTIWELAGSELATITPQDNVFVPNSDNFTVYTLNDLDYSNYVNVIVKFVHTKGDGNNLYIDDINITAQEVGVGTVLVTSQGDIALSVLPNPVRTNCFTLNIDAATFNSSSTSTVLHYKVFAQNGSILVSDFININTTMTINERQTPLCLPNALPNGIYYLVAENGANSYKTKFVVLNN